MSGSLQHMIKKLSFRILAFIPLLGNIASGIEPFENGELQTKARFHAKRRNGFYI